MIVDDVVWSYFGVWFFYDDGVSNVLVVMCDYMLCVNKDGGVLILNIFGGKIIIYCWLVEEVFDLIG